MGPLTRRQSLLAGGGGLMVLVPGCLATFRDPAYPTERVTEQGHADPLVIDTTVDRSEHIGRHWRSICHTEATSAISEHLESEIDHEIEHVTVGRSTSGGQFVRMVWTLDRAGNLIHEPTVEFEEVVDVTPESVTVTITVDGEEHACRDDIFVEKGTEHLD